MPQFLARPRRANPPKLYWHRLYLTVFIGSTQSNMPVSLERKVDPAELISVVTVYLINIQ